MTSPRDSRSVDLEVEVPGTPEQVWEAIATGPGISAWFVPTEVEEREGGTVTMHHGAGMEDTGTVTAWEPPHRFAFESDALGRTIGLELRVEAQAGGTCVVRLVNSGFGTDESWDAQFEGTVAGWRLCLRVLQLYLTHFPGQRGFPFVGFGSAKGPKDRAWDGLLDALGLGAVADGARVAAAPGTPGFAGVVDRAQDETAVVRLDEPVPGIGSVAAGGPGEPVYLSVSATLFGPDAEATAARLGAAWQAWMDERFPLESPAAADG